MLGTEMLGKQKTQKRHPFFFVGGRRCYGMFVVFLGKMFLCFLGCFLRTPTWTSWDWHGTLNRSTLMNSSCQTHKTLAILRLSECSSPPRVCDPGAGGEAMACAMGPCAGRYGMIEEVAASKLYWHIYIYTYTHTFFEKQAKTMNTFWECLQDIIGYHRIQYIISHIYSSFMFQIDRAQHSQAHFETPLFGWIAGVWINYDRTQIYFATIRTWRIPVVSVNFSVPFGCEPLGSRFESGLKWSLWMGL